MAGTCWREWEDEHDSETVLKIEELEQLSPALILTLQTAKFSLRVSLQRGA